MNRRAFVLGAPALLASCTAEPVWAPDDMVQRSIYRHSGPPSLTLITVLRTSYDDGMHSGLMVNGSQRVVFDPAGTFKHETIPERNDVIIGMTPTLFDVYLDYHTRASYYTVTQERLVTPEVAELALREVQGYGAVPKAMCTQSTSTVLRRLPGFDNIRTTYYPKRLMLQFGDLPRVSTKTFRDSDADDNKGVLRELDAG